MDNAKSYLPRFLEKTKENQGTERLPSKISGCIMYSGYYEHKRKTLFYINHDQVFCILFHMIHYNTLSMYIEHGKTKFSFDNIFSGF